MSDKTTTTTTGASGGGSSDARRLKRQLHTRLRMLEQGAKDARTLDGDELGDLIEDMSADLEQARQLFARLRWAKRGTWKCLHGVPATEACAECKRLATGEGPSAAGAQVYDEAADRAKELDSERELQLPWTCDHGRRAHEACHACGRGYNDSLVEGVRVERRCERCGGRLRPVERIDGPAEAGECSCWQRAR